MGLIDDIRKRKDSWTKRFEEHRDEEEYDYEYEKINADKVMEEIKRKRENVGKFPEKE